MATLQAAVSAVPGVTWLGAAPLYPLPGYAWVDEYGGLHVATVVDRESAVVTVEAVSVALAAVPLHSQAVPVVAVARIGGRDATVAVWAPTVVVDGGAP